MTHRAAGYVPIQRRIALRVRERHSTAAAEGLHATYDVPWPVRARTVTQEKVALANVVPVGVTSIAPLTWPTSTTTAWAN